MSYPNELRLEENDQPYDPPLLDSLRVDSLAGEYAIHFIPSDDVSTAPTELVLISSDHEDYYSRILACVNQIQNIAGRGPIAYVVHKGGGDFTLHFVGRKVCALSSFENAVSVEISDRLKQIADAAQMAFDPKHPAIAKTKGGK